MKNKAFRYYGELGTYFETGMEGIAFILHDDRGIKKSPDFNDETKKWDGPLREFHSIEWTHFISGGEHIRIFEKNGAILYDGPITNDREKVAKARPYRIFFAPKEMELGEWARVVNEKLKAEIWVDKPVSAEEKG